VNDSIVAVVVASGRARDLVRTADSVSRQTVRIERLVTAVVDAASDIPQSLAIRLGARTLAASTIAEALNIAARSGTEDFIALAPAGYRLDPRCIQSCLDVLETSPSVAAAAPSVRLETADGTRGILHDHTGLSFPVVLVDPSKAPAVLCIRRNAWNATGGMDVRAGVLSMFDLVLRFLATAGILPVPSALVHIDVAAAAVRERAGFSSDTYLTDLRYVLEKHHGDLEATMNELLVRSETAFGELRCHHRSLVGRRDAILSQLETLRAETAHLRAWLSHRGRDCIDWGEVRRTSPVSREWGYDRGMPVDRHYIHEFLAANSSDIHGSVLEVQEDDFSRTFGGPRVRRSDVLDLDDQNPRATIVADLRCAPQIVDGTYDCVILTQTIHVIDDMRAVLQEVHRVLRPGGTVLATLPCSSRVCLEYGRGADLWRVTPDGAQLLFESVFGPGAVESVAYGNVLTNVAFLEGIASEELSEEDFKPADPYFPALVGVRATRSRGRAQRRRRGAVLLYHRVSDHDDLHHLNVSPHHFESHLAWLRAECHVISLEELLETPLNELPDRAVALTFDDGYLECIERAAPALERFGFPATFFLTTRWLEEPGEYWWDTLERALQPEVGSAREVRIETANGVLTLPIGTPQQRFATHQQLHALLVEADLEQRDRIIDGLRPQVFEHGPTRRPMLADEVRMLARIPGVSIGAHSVNHLSLAHQTPAVVCREVDESHTALERLLGKPVADFAYPYGTVGRLCADHVRSGRRCGCACDEQAVGQSFDAARVPRIEVRNDTASALEERLRRVFESSLTVRS
jgi:peptidoglycan/xylan/chitin deacetylase (PgdA/CDA1 family)